MNDPGARVRRRRLLAAFITLLLLAAGTAWMLTLAAPAWWDDAGRRAGSPADAEALENTLVAQLTLVRDTDPAFVPSPACSWRSREWSVSIAENDAGAWLAHRFPKWLQHRGSARTPADARAHFRDDALLLGVRATPDAPIAWVTCVPDLRADGSLWLRASPSLGRVPASFDMLPSAPGADAVLDALAGKRPLLAAGTIALDDGRRVRVRSITLRDGTLDIRAVTEKP